jgi:hypothetical protein
MSQQLPFAGTIVRSEADGFTIIRFDAPVGPSANNFGLISSSTGTATLTFDLKPGIHVTGTAEAGERDLAAIKTIRADVEP